MNLEASRVIDRLLEGVKKRLAQAKVDAAKASLKPERQAAELSRRLRETHDLLKWQFRFAGGAATTKRIFDHCGEATSAWGALNNPDGP